ncbi:MAG: AAA family ATPase [Magnetococcales bacterium]|nr:AAA family ATPase [Magnetococcales bacterium]
MNAQKNPLGTAGNQYNFKPHATVKTLHDQWYSLDEIKSALSALTPNVDRDEWVRIAMALKAGLGDEGFQVFDSWSSGGTAYSQADARDVWRSIKPEGGITIKTLFRMARDVGWRWEPMEFNTGREAHKTRPRQPTNDTDPPSWLDDGPPPEAYDFGDVLPGKESGSVSFAGQQSPRYDPATIWAGCGPAPADHPYLVKKGVQAHGLRLYRGPLKIAGTLCDGGLVIPLVGTDGQLQTLQFVTPDGKKLLLPGHPKKGAFHIIGEPTEVICISEGFATAATIFDATRNMTVMAIDSGNLGPVAEAIRGKHPHHTITLIADDDMHMASNPGLTKATEAARAVGGNLAVPSFGPNRPDVVSDFNDLARLHGLEAARHCIEGAQKVEAGRKLDKQAANQEKAPATFNMRDLMALQFDPVAWTVRDLLPQGVFILAGKPKVGKSWMALHLGLSVAYGQRVFGSLLAERGYALYVSMEDHQRRLQNRVSQICREHPTDNLHFALDWPRIDGGCVKRLDDWLILHPGTKLVIFDTLARINPPRGRNGDIYAEDYAAVSAFKEISERHGVSIILVHHLRKMVSDDPDDMLSGTTGLAGGVDGTLILTRDARKPTGPLTLHRRGRDLINDEPLALDWNKESGEWRLLDKADVEAVAVSEEQQPILDVILRNGLPMTRAEIAEALGEESDRIRHRLSRMVTKGVLIKSGSYNNSRYSIAKTGDPPIQGKSTLSDTTITNASSSGRKNERDVVGDVKDGEHPEHPEHFDNGMIGDARGMLGESEHTIDSNINCLHQDARDARGALGVTHEPDYEEF